MTGTVPRPRLRRVLCTLRRCTLCGVVLYLVAGAATARLFPDPVGDAPALAAIPLIPRGGGDASESRDPEVVRGVLSVHTERSHDAEGTLREVAVAADRTGLDFVVLGDHPGEWARSDPEALAPRTMEGVLVIPGLEMAVSGVGRTLALGLDTLPRSWEGGLASLAERIAAREGFLSVVHPRSPKARESWDGLGVQGAHAWESFDVSEMARIRSQEPWVAYHVLSLLTGLVTGQGHRSLAQLWREGTATPALLAYDSARAAGPLTLTGGLNHHPKTRILGRVFPGYEPFFRTVVNHVLIPGGLAADPGTARTQIVRGLRSGRLYVTLGDPQGTRGFRFEGDVDGERVSMGGRTRWSAGARLSVGMPRDGGHDLLLRVLRDGREVAWLEPEGGGEFLWPVPGPGVYRVEVFKGGVPLGGLRAGLRPWILSNPVEFYSPVSSRPADDS